MDQSATCYWGLLRRRQVWLPSWRGWLLLVFLFVSLAVALARSLHPFLAVTHVVPGGELVLEGWSSDDCLQAALAECKAQGRSKLYVTGGPMDRGAPFSEYKTWAEFGAARLVKMGLSSNVVQAVPAPFARQDRTYAAASALRGWLANHNTPVTKLNVLTQGPHARRSRLLFEKAFGKRVDVGVVALPSEDYDPQHWWRSSAGVRTVLGESLAYLYARLLFRGKSPA